MRKLVCFSACLLALAWQPAPAHATDPAAVVVRSHEDPAVGRVVISHGTGKSEGVEFPQRLAGETPDYPGRGKTMLIGIGGRLQMCTFDNIEDAQDWLRAEQHKLKV
ncbi:MAG: hypothetical protein ACRYG7_07150 [Janthinobacterium lividum]